jgi:hypothetical protein
MSTWIDSAPFMGFCKAGTCYPLRPQILLPLDPYDASNPIRTPFPNTKENMHMLSDTPEYR